MKLSPLTGKEQLVIGILLCNRPVTEAWVRTVENLRAPLPYGILAKKGPGKNKHDEIIIARNSIAEKVLKVGARYLFFLDDDVVPPIDVLPRLLSVLEKNPKARVTGGIYHHRRDGRPLVWDSLREPMRVEAKSGQEFRCGGLAGGCMLIDTSVFGVIDFPWFRNGGPVAQGIPTISEDVIFCESVRSAGFEVIAHGGVLCQHLS